MSETLRDAIADTIAATLSAHDAWPIDFVGFVRYLHTTGDGDTQHLWATICDPGMDTFALAGTVQALTTWIDLAMTEEIAAAMTPDDEPEVP